MSIDTLDCKCIISAVKGMSAFVFFLILLALTSGYTFIYGGTEGRWIALALCVATWLSPDPHALSEDMISSGRSLLAIDVSVLSILGIAVHKTQRYWPIWLFGLQSVSCLSHLATFLYGDTAPYIYYAVESVWSLPMQIIMPIGIMLDRRNA